MLIVFLMTSWTKCNKVALVVSIPRILSSSYRACNSTMFTCRHAAHRVIQYLADPSCRAALPSSTALGSGGASTATTLPALVMVNVLPICTWSITSPGPFRKSIIEISSVCPVSNCIYLRRTIVFCFLVPAIPLTVCLIDYPCPRWLVTAQLSKSSWQTAIIKCLFCSGTFAHGLANTSLVLYPKAGASLS